MTETEQARRTRPVREQRIGDVPVLEWEKQVRAQLQTGGLWLRDTRGPAVEDLRPYGPRVTPGFPVYADLEERLLDTDEHPDQVIAHALATCAAYSYSDTETLSMIMARMGLVENYCRVFSSSVDTMFIRSTGYLVQSRTGRVAILCYRGTEPMNFINWLTDADVEPERMRYAFGDPCATVHAGFYRNVRATRYQVMGVLKRACRRESVRYRLPAEAAGNGARPARLESNLERLYITGHSLGGAMAAMMAVMLRHERKFQAETSGQENVADRLGAVYTFGQPMIGDYNLARACQGDDFLREKVIRYVYDSDVVPHLPAMTSGQFSHFGREWRYRVPHLRHIVPGLSRFAGVGAGQWSEQRWPARQALTSLGGFGMAVLSMLAHSIEPLRTVPWVYSFDDHRPNRYIDALTPSGVTNEFGD